MSWLDPPAVRARKQWLRSQPRRAQANQSEIGCLVPIGIALAIVIAVSVGIGAAIGMARGGTTDEAPRVVNVRVIDRSAEGGPKVLATAVVPLR